MVLLASSNPSKYFITTPIFYVNAAPHLGHLYSALLADAQARFRRLTWPKPAGQEDDLAKGLILFSTGTDEHGAKVQRAATRAGLDPSRYADQISDSYRRVFDNFGVGYTDYVRTTEERHKKAVAAFWGRLESNGCLEKRKFGGWYCVEDETFLTERQTALTPSDAAKRVSIESGHPVEWCEEENYVFRLAPFKERILKWLEEGDVIRPEVFRNHLSMLLDNESGKPPPDVSVSRPSARLPWGIPVPGDSSQTVYVWLDALVNYLTVAGFPDKEHFLKGWSWPPSCHVIGKDILKFHAVYWPAFLMAADLPLPDKILCHSHWTVDDVKMSKSKGNVVDPEVLCCQDQSLYPSEGLRYFLLREGVPHSDGNFSQKKMTNYLNAELANTLGNLLGRLTSSSVNKSQCIHQRGIDRFASSHGESCQRSRDLMSEVESLAPSVRCHYEDFNYYKGIDAIMNCLRNANAYVQDEKPWELQKGSPDEKQRLDRVLTISLECLRVAGILLQPIIPGISGKLLDKLGVGGEGHRMWESAAPCWILPDPKDRMIKFSTEKVVLFPRIKSN